MAALLVKLCAGAGVLLIAWGIYIKNEIKQDTIFALGGLCLLLYSIYLRDPFFIVLQIIFTGSSLYEIYKIKTTKSINISPH
jgi:Ca2+/Na+ antiporter